jgi:hypothetical protein
MFQLVNMQSIPQYMTDGGYKGRHFPHFPFEDAAALRSSISPEVSKDAILQLPLVEETGRI